MKSKEQFGEQMLSAALAYHSIGWSVIPIVAGKKIPAIKKWKPFQKQPADEHQIRDWFDGRDDLGIAVVCGKASGGLACRDFDVASAYEAWASQNPELVAELPIAKTSRGFHVYFRSQEIVRTQHFNDGELRGEGSLVILPPSSHPSGSIYLWLREPTIDIRAVATKDFWNSPSNPQTTHRETEHMASVSPLLCDSVSLSLCGCVDEGELIDRIIEETQPTKEGERNHWLFRLARRLGGVSSFRSADASAVESIVRRWHQLALPIIRTKPWSETWADFRNAWENAKFPEGMNVVGLAHEIASKEPLPPEALAYDSIAIQKLVGLCYQLQKLHGPGRDFFLSCRDAGHLIGRDFKDTSRWLRMLVSDKILKLSRPGNEKRAHRYRYTGRSWKDHDG